MLPKKPLKIAQQGQMESANYKLLAIKVDLETKTVEETWLQPARSQLKVLKKVNA